jgi:hypothetical protein
MQSMLRSEPGCDCRGSGVGHGGGRRSRASSWQGRSWPAPCARVGRHGALNPGAAQEDARARPSLSRCPLRDRAPGTHSDGRSTTPRVANRLHRCGTGCSYRSGSLGLTAAPETDRCRSETRIDGPPIGIESMTYALRVRRPMARHQAAQSPEDVDGPSTSSPTRRPTSGCPDWHFRVPGVHPPRRRSGACPDLFRTSYEGGI